MINHEDDVNSETEARILTHDDVNEQIRSYIALLTKQLEDLTRLLQGMLSTQQRNAYPRAATSDSFSIAGYQPDTGISGPAYRWARKKTSVVHCTPSLSKNAQGNKSR